MGFDCDVDSQTNLNLDEAAPVNSEILHFMYLCQYKAKIKQWIIKLF